MPESIEYSKSGHPIYRHQPREQPWEAPSSQDEDAIWRIEAHIETHVGKLEMVWHEIISDLVHIDVHHVSPSPERDFHTLITTGMSDRPMHVPPEAEEYRYAELMIYLPASWPLDYKTGADSEFSKEKNYWPIRWLTTLARLPHEYRTWLWYGHTVPNGDPPKPFAEGTDLSCMLMVQPMLEPAEFTPLEINSEKKIHFWALLPIYREEMEFKLEEGTDALLDRMEEAGVELVVDASRINACADRGTK